MGIKHWRLFSLGFRWEDSRAYMCLTVTGLERVLKAGDYELKEEKTACGKDKKQGLSKQRRLRSNTKKKQASGAVCCRRKGVVGCAQL